MHADETGDLGLALGPGVDNPVALLHVTLVDPQVRQLTKPSRLEQTPGKEEQSAIRKIDDFQ